MEISIVIKDALLEKPEESGYYLCRVDGEWSILHYSDRYEMFNVFDKWNLSWAIKNSTEVEFWATLPEV